MPKKLKTTTKPKAKPIVEEATQPIPMAETITPKEELSISIQSIKSINLDTDDKIYYGDDVKEYKETLWDKAMDKLDDLIPAWLWRIKDNIYRSYMDFTSSFTNWRKGYGWIPNSDIWDLYGTISKFISPRLKLFIDKQNSTPMAFAELENSNQKWIETLTAMLPAFMEEEDWFKWKYPDRIHPLDITITGDVDLLIKDGDSYKVNPDLVSTLKWKDLRAIEKEHLEERQKGIELFAKHFYSLWD